MNGSEKHPILESVEITGLGIGMISLGLYNDYDMYNMTYNWQWKEYPKWPKQIDVTDRHCFEFTCIPLR